MSRPSSQRAQHFLRRVVALVLFASGGFGCSATMHSATVVDSKSIEIAVARELDASNGAIVVVEPEAARIGARVLADGGNAVDAAIATAFALAVTWPEAGNVGGGGFMLVRLQDGDAGFIDYREVAPGRASATMFLRPDGSIDHEAIDHGWLGVGVPGTVAGLAMAHERYGSRPWSELVKPAAAIARRGFPISKALARSIASARPELAKNAESARIWLREDGTPRTEGEQVVLVDLANSLDAIAEGGARAFYEGAIAQKIVADSSAHGGLHTLEDFAKYEAVFREPLRGTYRGFDILAAPPPSSGGQILLSALNQLESLDEGAQFCLARVGTADELHLHAEALRRAFLERYRYLGDPDFVAVDIDRMISKERGRELALSFGATSIDRLHATPSRELAGDLDGTLSYEREHTTHFSVVDAMGNAVANTYTLEQSWGSKITAAGTGILMNDEMGDFNAKPGESTETGRIGTAPNVAAPGKRMLSSMCPVIMTKDDELALVAGSPGGRTIPSTVLRVVTGIVDHEMSPRELIDAPRIHHALFPDVLRVENALVESEAELLRSRGHTIERVSKQGDAHLIVREGGTLRAIADTRIDGAAATPRRE